MYTIEYSHSRDLLDIIWSGVFTPTEIVAYANDCRTCWHRSRFQEGYRLRIILQDDQTLPQNSLAELGRVFTEFPEAGRTAMVTRSAISRMQIKRAMMGPQMRIFDNPDFALEWLLGP